MSGIPKGATPKRIRNPKRAPAKMLKVVKGNNRNRNRIDREKDAWFAVNLLARGKTYKEIAEALNEKNGYKISTMQAWRDIEEILVEWKRENMANIDAFIAKELARLQEIESIVMQNFEKSKLPRPGEYSQMLKAGMTPDEVDALYQERGGLAGDPKFLDTMLRLQKQRMNLLGIGSGTDVPQQNIINYNFGDAKIEDLIAITDSLQDSHKAAIEAEIVE